MKRKIILGTAAMLILNINILSASISNSLYFGSMIVSAEENKVVNIPDENLKKVLTDLCNTSNITAQHLAKIKELNLFNLGINSIEGLEYCTNLEKLILGTSSPFEESNSNTISDLSPLKGLTKLTTLKAGGLQIVDFSPLKNVPLKWESMFEENSSFLSNQMISARGNVNEDGSFSFKNPCKNQNGSIIKPENLHGGYYDDQSNEIVWNDSSNFSKVGNQYFAELVCNDATENNTFCGPSICINITFEKGQKKSTDPTTVISKMERLYWNKDYNSKIISTLVTSDAIETTRKAIENFSWENIKDINYHPKEYWLDLLTFVEKSYNDSEFQKNVQLVENLFSDNNYNLLANEDITLEKINFIRNNIKKLDEKPYSDWKMCLDIRCSIATKLLEQSEKKVVHISSVLDKNKCLDSNPAYPNLFVWNKVENADNHKYVFHKINDEKKIFTISSEDNKRWLVADGNCGSSVTQTQTKSDASFWKIEKLNNGSIMIRYAGNNKLGIQETNLAINLEGYSTANGTRVILWWYGQSYENEQFILN